MDRGTCRAPVHGVSKSQLRLNTSGQDIVGEQNITRTKLEGEIFKFHIFSERILYVF